MTFSVPSFMSLIDARTSRVLFTVLLFALALGFLYIARRTLIAFLFAIFFAYLVDPAVSRVEQWVKGRGRAIGVIYLLLVTLLVTFFFFVGPQIARQGQRLSESLPKLLETVSSGQIAEQIGKEQGWSVHTRAQLSTLSGQSSQRSARPRAARGLACCRCCQTGMAHHRGADSGSVLSQRWTGVRRSDDFVRAFASATGISGGRTGRSQPDAGAIHPSPIDPGGVFVHRLHSIHGTHTGSLCAGAGYSGRNDGVHSRGRPWWPQLLSWRLHAFELSRIGLSCWFFSAPGAWCRTM